jgi:hypothetical protein
MPILIRYLGRTINVLLLRKAQNLFLENTRKFQSNKTISVIFDDLEPFTDRDRNLVGFESMKSSRFETKSKKLICVPVIERP